MEYETQEIIYEGLEDSEGVKNSRDAKGNILKYYLNNFKRRWYVILICTILGFTPAYIWSRREQTYYTGNFEMLLEPATSEEQVTDPSVLARLGTSASTNIFGVDYPTILKLLKSEELMKNVAQRVNRRLPQYSENFLLSSFRSDLQVARASAGRSRFDATKIVVVTYKSNDPQLVQEVLKNLSEEYINYSIQQREKNLKSGVSFIDKQLPVIRKRIDTLQDQQKVIQRQYELIQPQVKGDSLFGINNASKQQITVVETELEQARLLSAKLQRDLGLNPQEALAATTLSQDPERQSLLNQLQQIESQIALESALVTTNHPNIVNLEQQKENIEDLIEKENQRILSENNISLSINPRAFVNQDANRLGLIQRLVETTNQIDLLSTRYDSLRAEQIKTSRELAQIPEVIKQYNDLQRQIELDTNILNQLSSQKEALSVDVSQKQEPWEIISQPKIPTDVRGKLISVRQSSKKLLAGGFMGGLCLGLLASIGIEKRKDIFYQATDLEHAFGLPILGTLPSTERTTEQILDDTTFFVNDPIQSQIIEHSSVSQSSISEIYTKLYFSLNKSDDKRSILICSLNPADGQAYVCSQLAKTAAAIDQKVLLVDGNIFEEEISPYFEDNVRRGLRELLQDVESRVIKRDSNTGGLFYNENISILTAGRENSDLPLNIGSQETQSIIQSLAGTYSLVLYNTSFFLEIHDLSLLAEKTKGMIMVVKASQTSYKSITKAIARVKNFNLNFLGFVVVE